jgi:hypothetical protein
MGLCHAIDIAGTCRAAIFAGMEQRVHVRPGAEGGKGGRIVSKGIQHGKEAPR